MNEISMTSKGMTRETNEVGDYIVGWDNGDVKSVN